MPHVALFDPCYMAALRPADAAHARRVLEALGDTVTLIDGRCCGQPAFNSGFRGEAKVVGLQLLRVAQPHRDVVALSGSCTAMVQHYLPTMFDGTKRLGAESIGHRFTEFAAYVARHPNLDALGLQLEGTVAYHDSCHARRELGLTETVVGLLSRIRGLDLRRLEHEAECCGFGGSFSVKLPEVSAAMMTVKLGDLQASGARILVSTDLSCLAHLEAGARGLGMQVEMWSIAELLSRALE
jgi:L-lactate dehydrogenase complex protein LldE